MTVMWADGRTGDAGGAEQKTTRATRVADRMPTPDSSGIAAGFPAGEPFQADGCAVPP